MTTGNDENENGNLSARQKYQKEYYAKRKANGVVSPPNAENRKNSNKYYEQRKEKRLRMFENGEGSSNSTTPSSNISQPFERIPLRTMNTNTILSANISPCQGSSTRIVTRVNGTHFANVSPRVETTQICSGITHEVVNEVMNSDVSQDRYEIPLRPTNIHQPSERLLQRSRICSELTHQTLNGTNEYNLYYFNTRTKYTFLDFIFLSIQI